MTIKGATAVNPPGLLPYLQRFPGDTRRYLFELVSRMELSEVEALLRGVRSMPMLLRRALKEIDRQSAWASKPPSEKQIEFLRRLGYDGPLPENVLEASLLIGQLLEERQNLTQP